MRAYFTPAIAKPYVCRKNSVFLQIEPKSSSGAMRLSYASTQAVRSPFSIFLISCRKILCHREMRSLTHRKESPSDGGALPVDTNICIYIAKHNPPAVRERFARHTADELVMSVVTLGELRFGAKKASRANVRLPPFHNLNRPCKSRHSLRRSENITARYAPICNGRTS